MPVSGIVVVPFKGKEKALVTRLNEMGVDALGIGKKGIACVVEASSSKDIERKVKLIESWDDVVNVSLIYHNFEDETRELSRDYQ